VTGKEFFSNNKKKETATFGLVKEYLELSDSVE
jgi:hypothetical protein